MVPRLSKVLRLGSVVAAGLALAACGEAEPESSGPPITIGLSTSLPIFWPETADPSELLAQDRPLPWPREVIERRHRLVPLDTLAGGGALDGIDALLLVQPRPLSPGENVALDQWVRDGGHVLVFADPVLTQDSRFALGDKRRPQDVALLSPILSRWGLELQVDDADPDGERVVEDALAGAVPVHLAGRLRRIEGAREAADQCEIGAQALIARCRIGRGRATIVADAALFEQADGSPDAARQGAVERLVDSLARDAAGRTGANRGKGGVAGESEGGSPAQKTRKGYD